MPDPTAPGSTAQFRTPLPLPRPRPGPAPGPRPRRRRPRPHHRRGGRPDPRPPLHPRGDHRRLPLPGQLRRPLLPRRRGPPAGLACRPRPAGLLARRRRLLQGPPTPARVAPAAIGPPRRRPDRRSGPRVLGLPRPPRRHRRRLDGEHARHPREPGRVPPALGPEAGLRLPDRPDRRADLPGHRLRARRGHRALARGS